jgi:hypothetical protein
MRLESLDCVDAISRRGPLVHRYDSGSPGSTRRSSTNRTSSATHGRLDEPICVPKHDLSARKGSTTQVATGSKRAGSAGPT